MMHERQTTDSSEELEWLVCREIPHLRRYALALLHHREAADDLVQDCLERALRKRHLWRYRGSVRSWLFRILYRLFLNQQARAKASARDVRLDDLAGPLAESGPQETRLACHQTVAGLRALAPEQRAAILLVVLEGVAYDEAAHILGVPVGTVRSRLSRGREALRRMGLGAPRQEALRRVK